MLKNVVAEEHFYDSAEDYYKVKYTYFDGKAFRSKTFIEGQEESVEWADGEIRERYERKRRGYERFRDRVMDYSLAVARLRCPLCGSKLRVVKNKRFLWLVSKKFSLPKPYEVSLLPRGSCGEQYFVAWCPRCKVNFVRRVYYRDCLLMEIRNLEVVKVIEIYSGIGHSSISIHTRHRKRGYCGLCFGRCKKLAR